MPRYILLHMDTTVYRMTGKTSPLLTIVLLLVQPFTAYSETIEGASGIESLPPLLNNSTDSRSCSNPDAYYTDLALRKKPISHVGRDRN